MDKKLRDGMNKEQLSVEAYSIGAQDYVESLITNKSRQRSKEKDDYTKNDSVFLNKVDDTFMVTNKDILD